MTNTITYHSQNAPAGQEWMAYAVLPNGKRWDVPATANNEAEAVEKIVSLYESEVVKIKPVYVQMTGRATRPDPETVDAWGSPVSNGRGSHFIGKSWLINTVTREKIRVPTGEIEKYLADGWQRGGPRSK